MDLNRKTHNYLLTELHPSDFEILYNNQIKYNKFLFNKVRKKLYKKFSVLDRTDDTVKLTLNSDDDCITNLTNVDIPNNVKSLLCFGQKFALPTIKKNAPLFDLISDVEHTFDNLTYIKLIDSNIIQDHRFNILNEIISFIKHNNRSTKLEISLLKASQSLKRFIISNPEILILNSDKSKKTVLMMKEDYNNKMED